jgi:hypothetical protein
MPTPSCFISYSWDDIEHKGWVLKLATALRSAGVEVLLDQWDVHLGMDLTAFMERAINDSQYVLLVCTPVFAQKANLRRGGVGYEQAVVTGEIFERGLASEKKFVPVLRRGDSNTSLPTFLKSRVLVDFRSDANFDDSVERLLRHLHATPITPKPPLGPAPQFGSRASIATPAGHAPKPRVDPELFKKLESFAYGPDGLDLSTRGAAKQWASERMRSWQHVDLEAFTGRFKELSDFAYSSDGLNLSTRAAAREWALNEVLSEFGVE